MKLKEINIKTFPAAVANTKNIDQDAAVKLAMLNEDRELVSRIVVVAKTS